MRYITARYAEYQRLLMYRIYISDISRYSENVPRYWDYIKPEKQPEETRSGDEIAADIINRLKKEGG